MVFPVFSEARDNHLKTGFMNNQHTNNEKSSMTYEKLMNSHFLKYPTSNPVVYAIFNPFMTALISFVAITAYVKIVDGDWMMALITALVASAFMQMKMSLMFMNVDGHGVGISKRGKLSVMGLPNAAVVMLGILLLIILAINFIAFTADTTLDFARVKMFGVSMLFGYILSICSWRFHTFYDTWYGSEYNARMEFKGKGNTDEQITEKIAKLKEMGILR